MPADVQLTKATQTQGYVERNYIQEYRYQEV